MPYVRCPKSGLGGTEGTGLKTQGQTDTPAAAADNAPGTWNTLYAKVVDDRITLIENGVTLAENVVLTNPCAPGEPVCVRGRIELSGLAAPACFRNLYIGELPSTPVFELSPEEAGAGLRSALRRPFAASNGRATRSITFRWTARST